MGPHGFWMKFSFGLNRRSAWALSLPCLIALCLSSTLHAQTVAWWRFDDDGVPAGKAAKPLTNAYRDSSQQGNALRRNEGAHPPESSTNVPDWKMEKSNTLSLHFPAKMQSQEIFSEPNLALNSLELPEVTLEGAFQCEGSEYFRGILCKDGQPNPSFPFPLLQVVFTRADPDPVNIGDHLVVQWTDGKGTGRMLKTIAPLAVGRWYAFAVVMTQTTASLYVKHEAKKDYQLEQVVPIEGGALLNATGRWAVGRGFFDGKTDNPYYGWLDEIRISKEPLPKEKFLFHHP